MTGGATAPLRGRLHHLQLGSPDPERLARFYGDVFGVTAVPYGDGFLCRGPDRCVHVVEGAAKGLVSAGYRLESDASLQGLVARLHRQGVPFGKPPLDLLGPEAIAVRDPAGNLIAYGTGSVPAPAAAREAPPGRLQHLVVGSRDAVGLADFYTRVIGLRVSDRVLDEEGGLRTVFLRSDDEHHSFAVFQTDEDRFDHHCYELPDWNAIRDWGDRLAARRIPVKWGPGRHGPGNNLFLFFHDPDGNWVEVSAELQIVAPDHPVGVWAHEERTLNSWGQAFLRS